ncbi:MAG: hypothetical protein ACYDBB_21075 [Armatimonadota bacterium]
MHKLRRLHTAASEVTSRKPQRSRSRWWILLAILATVLVLYAGNKLWHAWHDFRVVARYPVSSESLHTGMSGFLLNAGTHRFTMRDWQGNVRWEVATGSVSVWYDPGWRKLIDYREFPYSVSPNGQVFAAIVSRNGRQMRVRSWQDGQLLGDAALPFTDIDVGLRALDNGQVLAWNRDGCSARSALYAISGNRIVAAGAEWCQIAEVSPDGKLMRGQSYANRTFTDIVAAVTVTGNRITLTRSFTPRWNKDYHFGTSIFNGGAFLSTDGSIYRNGLLAGRTKVYTHEITSDSGDYALLYRGASARVIAPATGAAWDFRLPGSYPGDGMYAEGIIDGVVSDNGQFVIVKYQQDTMAEMRKRLSRFPAIVNRLPDTTWVTSLALFARPGRLVARVPLDYAKWKANPSVGARWHVSPDGHALVVILGVDEKKTAQCLLLRRR